MKTPIHRSLLASALALLSMLLAPSVQAQTLNDLYPELAAVVAADLVEVALDLPVVAVIVLTRE